MVPVLTDVDGDEEAEIIFGTEGESNSTIYVTNMDGSPVPEFPLFMDYYLRNSVCIADVDNDGKK